VARLAAGEPFAVEVTIASPAGSTLPRPWIGVRVSTWAGDLVANIEN
jgi:hypothetical protein